MEILEALKKARENSKQRNFSQTWDLTINLRGIDFSKPENRFSGNVILPHIKGKKTKICIIADSKVTEAKKLDVGVIDKDQLKKLAKPDIKKLVDEYDYFLGETTLMAQIGKILGPVLGPRGKMPKPFPPNVDLEGLVKSGKKNFSLNVKNPVIQGAVGNEKMKDDEVGENIKTIVNFVEGKLPKGKQQIDSIIVKMTMGKPVKVKL
ncbi:MAG: 50S ribosomal protein L1 [archaeon]|nr:MAG: 50S ribosomal protein L1 [archaeon]